MRPRWRLVVDDGAEAPAGLALDEALMRCHAGAGTRSFSATLRLYTYRPHCALVGRYQSVDDELDLEACAREDVQIGRRPTGGGAILMGPDQLGVALALAAPAGEAPRGTLQRLAGGVVAGLAELGVEAGFRSKNDLEAGGRKVAGLGLYRDDRGALLFHASVLVDLDVELMLRVLRIPGAKLVDKGIERVVERVTTVRGELDRPVAVDEVRWAIASGMARACDVELVAAEPDEADLARRDELLATRYGAAEWLWQRSARRDRQGAAVLKTPEGLLRIHVGLHGPTIKSALLAGDFNAMPPALAALESALRWHRADEGALAATVARHLGADALGVAPEAVARALWAAVTAAGRAESPASLPDRSSGSCYFPATAPPAAVGVPDPVRAP